MNKLFRYFFVFLLTFFAFWNGCSRRALPGDEVIATIGNEKIYFSQVKQSADRLNRFLKENFETSDAWRKDFIHQYIARRALAKRAEREGLAKDKNIVFAIEQARLGILADKLLEDKLSKISVSEDDVLKFYEENKTKYENKPFEKVKTQVEFEYNKKLKDEAINRFVMDTFVEEKVRMFDDIISKVKP